MHLNFPNLTLFYSAPPENGDTTVAETASPVASPTPSPIEEKLSDEEAIAGEEIGEQNQGGAKDPINAGEGGDGVDQDTVVVAENGALGTGPIIGIATAAAAALLFFFLVAGRRHSDNDREKELGEVVEGDESFMSEGTPDLKYFAGTDALADTGEKSSVSKKRSIGQFDPSGAASIALGRRDDDAVNRSSKASGTSSVDQIVSAIDQANWDEVYKLASQLAEQEDLSTLSSVGKQNARRAATGISTPTRTHLSEEDQGRTRTLDELVDGGDWTGVAVTAALYAGERGSSGAQSSAKRSFFDIVTGKRATSTLAASASQEEDTLGIMRPFTTSALGALTDDTKSGTTDEVGTSFDASSPQRSPVFKHVPPAGAFGLLPSNPTSSDSSVTLARLKERIDAAVDCGDWDAVLMLSSEVESNSSYQHTYAQFPHTPMKSLESGSTSQSPPALRDEAALDVTKVELNRAINLGDWAHVGIYANMIAENKPMESRALVPSNQPQSIVSKNSEDTSGSEMAKRHTIEKLVQAGKWKGVSIMAGLYEMESTGAVSSQARGNENLALTESEDAQPWFKIFSSSSKDSQDDRKPASRGWTGMINLSRANDETPQKTKVIIPGDQKSPPPLMKKEEVQLRNTTELRDADRVDGDILRPTETGPAGFKRVESQDPNAMQGAKLLLPYWHKKGGKSDPPEGSNV